MINEYYLPGLNDKSQNVSLQNDIVNKFNLSKIVYIMI